MYRKLFVLALLWLVWSRPGRPQPPYVAAAPGVVSPFGLNAGVANRFWTAAEREHAVQMLVQAGAGLIREEFCWSCIESPTQQSAHAYRWQINNWFDYDQMMSLTADRRLNILGLLDYGPAGDVRDGRVYRRQSCPADANAAPIDAWLPAWRDYVRTVVLRYGGWIKYWEVENEPTFLCFWRKVDLPAQRPSAADYLKVLRAASEVIRQTDPQARVVLAGLSPEIDTTGVDYFQFLTQVQAAGGWPDFDIVAIHPYRSPFAPEQVLPRSRFDVDALQMDGSRHPYDLQAEVTAFERLMAHWGPKPLWLTEIGWSVASLTERARQRGTQPEVVQADYLVRSYVQSLAAGAQVVMWYDFRDDTIPDAGESSFGLIRRDFSPKPAYDAFSTLAHLLAGSRFLGQVRGGGDQQDDVYEYRFGRGSQTVAVLWRSQADDGPRMVQVTGIPASTALLVGPDLGPFSAGAGRIVTAVAGRLEFALGERPIFVVFDGEYPAQPLPLIP
jgi:hypothetical protein